MEAPVVHLSGTQGAVTNQPRAERRGNSRRATPWVRYRFNAVALKGQNKSVSPIRIVRQIRARLVSPLQGSCSPSFITQGGAARLRRSALPWAAMWLPLRGENLWITRSGSPKGHSVIRDFPITLRSQTGTESGIREDTNSRQNQTN